MHKFFKNYWQLFILPALYIPYSILNRYVIVSVFGCGCPSVNDEGVETAMSFNANDFTLVFFGAAALAVAVISFIKVKKLSNNLYKAVFLTLNISAAVIMAYAFYRSMLWK